MNPAAEGDAPLPARVTDHLQPGENLVAAIWVSRPAGVEALRISRSEMSPWRLRRATPEPRRGVNGRPRSHAVALDEHIRTVNDPRVLALTDRRVLLLSQGLGSWRDLLPRPAGTLSPLRLRWESPRTDLTKATEQSGHLRLDFTDGSYLILLTPSAHVQPFLIG